MSSSSPTSAKQLFVTKLKALRSKYNDHYSRIRAKIIRLKDDVTDDKENKNCNRQCDIYDKCRHNFDKLNSYFDTISCLMDEDMDVFQSEVLSLFKDDKDNSEYMLNLFNNIGGAHDHHLVIDDDIQSVHSLATTVAFPDDVCLSESDRNVPLAKISNPKKRNRQKIDQEENDGENHDKKKALSAISEPPSKKRRVYGENKSESINTNNRNKLRKNRADADISDVEILDDDTHSRHKNIMTSASKAINGIKLKSLSDSQSAKASQMKYDEDSSKVYCPICRQPYDGLDLMIQCDVKVCQEWYHLACVGLPEAKVANVDYLEFKCPVCNGADSKQSSVMEINGIRLKPLSDTQAGLLQIQLLELRKELKEENNVRTLQYVYTDVVTAKMAKFAPVTLDDLSHFEGFNDIKLKKYGDSIVESIRDYINSNELMSPFKGLPQHLRISKKDALKRKAPRRKNEKNRK